MLRYLIRYEVARALLSGPGLMLAAILLLALASLARHWEFWAALALIEALAHGTAAGGAEPTSPKPEARQEPGMPNAEEPTGLLRAAHAVASTQRAVERMLDARFPACQADMTPDQYGNASTAPTARQASASYRLHAEALLRLATLVTSQCEAAAHKAARAMRQDEALPWAALRTLARPTNPDGWRGLAARLRRTPAEDAEHEACQATANAAASRLWHVHAWILALRLAVDMSPQGGQEATAAALKALSDTLDQACAPGAEWARSSAAHGRLRQEVVARAPEGTLIVRTIPWPSGLGGPESEQVDPIAVARALDARQADATNDGCWIDYAGRHVKVRPTPEAGERMAAQARRAIGDPKARRHAWSGNGGTPDAYASQRLR